MHYITDYQLDIHKGFMCKVNGKTFKCEFLISNSTGKHFYISNILHVADAMGIPRHEFISIFNSDHVNHVIYCDSKQQCYDLCQHIVKTYFKPVEASSSTLVCLRYNEKTFRFRLVMLEDKYVWQNEFNSDEHIVNRHQIDFQKVKKELGINLWAMYGSGYIGFDTKEDALKFANYIKVQFYNRQEWIQHSRRHLAKYYSDDESSVILNNVEWHLLWDQKRNMWYFYNAEHGYHTFFRQFGIKDAKEAIAIGSKLGLLVQFTTYKLEFESKHDAIKFTDYLIETYIIKKEKTYDTNQLRKERTAISRGAKPAGSIIHGRRSKASVRCGRIEHKACLGY